jgi:hypothetical protein
LLYQREGWIRLGRKASAEGCHCSPQDLPEFPAAEGDSGRPMTFKRVLLNTCQEEFEGAHEAREVRMHTTLAMYRAFMHWSFGARTRPARCACTPRLPCIGPSCTGVSGRA